MLKKKKSDRDILCFNDLPFRLIGIPVLGFFIPLIFFDVVIHDSWPAFLQHWAISMLYTTTFWQGGRWIVLQLRRRYQRKEEEVKRLTLQLTIVTIYASSVCIFLGGIFQMLGIQIGPTVELQNALVGSLSVTYLIIGIYEVVYFYRKWEQALTEKERFKKDALQSQLESLKAQINPHFLFNSLNTLAYIIPQNPDTAVQFVQQLSKVYRYILEMRNKETISLEEELNFLDAYVYLLKQRFEENLQIDLQIPPTARHYHVVPLALQMLFENAIKHNIISTADPLKIEVFLEEERLIVRNNLQPKHQETASTKLGLENIRSRYQFFTQEEVDVIVTQRYFIVALPLLKVEEPSFSHN
ncbi:MAG: histidine kinase [Phaeodactylibacter sp.]|nr:histidine kinase [Phaeodactylibacter sp.]